VFDPDRGSVRTWVYAIARHAASDQDRRRARRPVLEREDEEADPAPAGEAESIERAALRWQIRAALDRLTPEHRRVIELAHFHGLTLREIAEQTGIPIGTVKSRTSYALRNLRLALDEMGVTS
jgi:RNA polymerase sigma-70 factor (ECF subfamily)